MVQVVKHQALRRRVYLLEAVGEGGKFLDVHGAETTTADKDQAAQFSSRLAARAWAETNMPDSPRRWLPFPHELVADLPPPPQRPDFRVGTVEECCQIVTALHNEYCSRAEGWLGRCGIEVDPADRPTLRMTATWHSWAGVYEPAARRVTYSLHHAMLHLGTGEGEESPRADYRITVAHEVSHAYQPLLCGPHPGRIGHGGDFYAIMRRAMGEPVTKHTHSYDAAASQAASAWLQAEVERLSTEGRLVALACPVGSDKVDSMTTEVVE